MVRAMCGQKVVDRKTTEEQMDTLKLKKIFPFLKEIRSVSNNKWS